MPDKPVIILVGAGSMGGSMLRSWLSSQSIDQRSVIIDPYIDEGLAAKCRDYGLGINPDMSTLIEDHHQNDAQRSFVVFAIKPQMATEIIPDFSFLPHSNVFISVMAGVTTETLRGLLQGSDKLIRVMPNLPASVGAGVSGLFATDKVDTAEREMATHLLNAVGTNVWVDTENQIDMVTAISGSGPAYFFLMVEALALAGIKLGLDEDVAQKLARSTAIGSGVLMAEDQRNAQTLREAVTSPGGTTAAALSVLDDDAALKKLMEQAAKAAFDRARELA